MPGRGLTLRLIATIADLQIGRAPVLSRRFELPLSIISTLCNCGNRTLPHGVTHA